ncbi:MAG: hypothetical protein K2Y37_07765 [Pirellulales bacterium]|nr:hypothetical protein [Pirellulales bacterium]
MNKRLRNLPLAVLLLMTGFVLGRFTEPSVSRAVPGGQQIPPSFPHVDEILVKLDSPEQQVRSKGFAQFRDEHAYLVAELIERVDERTDEFKEYTTAHLAARILSKIGGRQAVPLLIDAIDYHQPEIVTRLSSFNGYPCAKALMEIGETSIPQILSYLRAPRHPEYEDGHIAAYGHTDPVSDTAMTLYACMIMNWNLAGWDEKGSEEWLEFIRHFCQRSPDSENLTRLDRELARMATEGVGFPRK